MLCKNGIFWLIYKIFIIKINKNVYIIINYYLEINYYYIKLILNV